MDPDHKNFGRGPKELTGSVDLVNQYKLLTHHKFFCKKSLPLAISSTHYLYNVVGDTNIRKGEGMELDQLIKTESYSVNKEISHIKPFDLISLGQAFPFRETTPIYLPPAERGIPTISGNLKSKSKDRDKKDKKNKNKDKEHKKHKHRHRDRSKDKEKMDGDQSKMLNNKKREHDVDEGHMDIHKYNKLRIKF